MSPPRPLDPNPDCILDAPAGELVDFALSTPLDPLYYLVLNTLTMRGERAALESLRRELDDEEDSIDRRFAATRACGDAAGALDLVAREGGVLAMVPDLLVAAREAGRVQPLIEFCVEKKALPSWYKPIGGLHALLAQLTHGASDELRARLDILPWGADDLAMPVAAAARIRLAGIVKVHNEGPRVMRIVETLLAFCDDVVLWDHNSVDGSVDALARLPAADRARLEIVRSTAADYNERIIYDELFARARNRAATHICHFDADEILATTLPPARLRDVAARLAPGDVASVELVQRVGGAGACIDYGSAAGLAAAQYYLPHWRDILYADDGRALHAQTHLHGGWLPEGTLKRRAFLDPLQVANHHMDKPDANAAKIKNDWYKAKEIVLHRFPVDKLVYRYMFYALAYAHIDDFLVTREPLASSLDRDIESKRVEEKKIELRGWLDSIKDPLERWLFFYA